METFCGGRCHLQRLGQGDGVILLHGWGQDMRMMRLIQNELKDHYRVVNLDLPGFGESGEPSAPWGIEEYARFIHEIAEHDHMEAPILIAHSFGARIAIRYASRYPTKKMVLSGAAGIRAPLSWQRRASQHWHHLKRRMGMRGSAGSPDYQKASPIMKQVLVRVVNEDLSPDLAAIRCPVLLIWGSEDRETPLWMGRKMEKEIPGARMIVYRDEDHFAYYHQGFRFMRDVCAFLGCGYDLD